VQPLYQEKDLDSYTTLKGTSEINYNVWKKTDCTQKALPSRAKWRFDLSLFVGCIGLRPRTLASLVSEDGGKTQHPLRKSVASSLWCSCPVGATNVPAADERQVPQQPHSTDTNEI